MSELKTVMLLAGLAVVLASVFKIGGLSIGKGIAIGAVLIVAGNLIPETATT